MGALVGGLQVYGFHLPLGVVLSRVFRLNLIAMFLATNLRNPILAPLPASRR